MLESHGHRWAPRCCSPGSEPALPEYCLLPGLPWSNGLLTSQLLFLPATLQHGGLLSAEQGRSSGVRTSELNASPLYCFCRGFLAAAHTWRSLAFLVSLPGIPFRHSFREPHGFLPYLLQREPHRRITLSTRLSLTSLALRLLPPHSGAAPRLDVLAGTYILLVSFLTPARQ